MKWCTRTKNPEKREEEPLRTQTIHRYGKANENDRTNQSSRAVRSIQLRLRLWWWWLRFLMSRSVGFSHCSFTATNLFRLSPAKSLPPVFAPPFSPQLPPHPPPASVVRAVILRKIAVLKEHSQNGVRAGTWALEPLKWMTLDLLILHSCSQWRTR